MTDGLRAEFRAEAARLLRWWADHMPDDLCGGFWGEVDHRGRPVGKADKSVILNTRMLWFFSAMAGYLGAEDALMLAHRAAAYIRRYFLDPKDGGLWWMLDHRGRVTDDRKQAYAQAFAIYAFAEYYRVTADGDSLTLARTLQAEIETRFWDGERGGYIEAMSADWGWLDDQRLSDKDINCPKTMNTHLHILEAYTNLHRVAPDEASRAALHRALDILVARFVDAGTYHLRLFFDMDWTDRTDHVSFGHDIEASWLIWEAAEVLGDTAMSARVRPLVLGMARATLDEGRNAQGGIAYERGHDGHVRPAGEWWCQAEGMIGFVNAWQLGGDQDYLAATERLWVYLKAQFGAGGTDEWSWYPANDTSEVMYRAGMWKCPYHNGRAMIELDRRLKT